MRKKYFRYMMKMFRLSDFVLSVSYEYNLRIVRTEKVTAVLVNLCKQKKVTVYYFYMPENLYLNYDTLNIFTFETHRDVYRYIKKEVNKIENDDIYRKYRIAKRLLNTEKD